MIPAGGQAPVTSRTIHSSVASTMIAATSSWVSGADFGTLKPWSAGYDGQLGALGKLLGATHRVTLALDHQHRDAGAGELGHPRLLGSARRVQREGQRQVRRRRRGTSRCGPPSGRRRSVRRPRAGCGAGSSRRRSAAPSSSVGGGGGDLPAGHPPGLLQPDHGDALAGQRGRQRVRSWVSMPTAGAVAEQQRGDGVAGPADVTSRASPCGVGIVRTSLMCPLSPTMAPTAQASGSGASSSGPLLRTLPTIVDTGYASSSPGAAGSSSASRSRRRPGARVEPGRPALRLAPSAASGRGCGPGRPRPGWSAPCRSTGTGPGRPRRGRVAPDLVEPGHRQHAPVAWAG